MNLATNGRTFAEKIGGRWALSVPGFMICFGVGGAGVTINNLALDGEGLAVALAAYVTIMTFVALLSLLLHRTRWSNRHEIPVPVHEVALLAVVVGVMVAGAFSLVHWLWGVDTGYGSIEGFVIYPIVGTWMGLTSVVYLDVIDRARHLRENVIAAHANASQVRERARQAVGEMRRLIDDVVSPAVANLRDVAATEQPSIVSAEIREVVDESVRAVSHDLWERVDERVARIGFSDMVRDVVVRPRFRTWAIIGLVIVLPFIDRVGDDGLIVVLPYAVAMFVVYLECTAANRLLLRWPQRRLLIVLATLTVFVAQSVLVDRVSESWGLESTGQGWVTVTAFTVLLVLVTSILGSYRDLDDRRAMALAADIRADRLDAMAEARVMAEETRRLAGLLHGRVQSRLLGCAMAIEFAGDDPSSLQAALDRTSAVLAEDWYQGLGDDSTKGSILDVLITWNGVAQVEVAGDRWLMSSKDPDLVAVVEELVANAIRHGGARRVEVTVERDGSDRIVTVVDDGIGGPMTRPGLGTTLLERVGAVDRRIGEDGWSVTVRLTNENVESSNV